jgi:L-aspartate oxidase
VNALIHHVRQQSQITVFENHMAINLITQSFNDITEVLGAYVLDEDTSKIHVFLAKIVVLATGGAGKVYRYTSNPVVATGDGIAMAYRAGARIANMEFYQFHPTLLYHLGNQHFLISEALRGEGAYLRLPTTGERFMQRYAPEAMELATRDIVARAIFQEIEKNNIDYVHLDIRHKDRKFLSERFPMIYRTLLDLGIDMAVDCIPVVPAAHYLCGGVYTDEIGNTDIARLLALGEVACTGLHGANRLASNSLLEGVVMGRMAAENSDIWLDKQIYLAAPLLPWSSQDVHDPRRASQLHVHWRGLRGEMMAYAGLIRTEAGLRDQLELILLRKKMIETYYWHYVITTDLIELRNIVLIAELIVQSALLRCESRGGHFREDCPEKIAEYDETVLQLLHY